MKQWLLTILAGSLVAVCATGSWGGPPAGDDLKGLQGTWVLTVLELNGEKVAIDALKDGKTPLAPRLVVKGERYTLYLADKPYPMTCRLDPVPSPRQITLTVAEGPEKGKAFHGIYKLEGDSFTICRSLNAGQPGPTAFATTRDSALILGVWKQSKP